jgi:hypothetical protein
MDRSGFPVEVAIAVLVFFGFLLVSEHWTTTPAVGRSTEAVTVPATDTWDVPATTPAAPEGEMR